VGPPEISISKFDFDPGFRIFFHTFSTRFLSKSDRFLSAGRARALWKRRGISHFLRFSFVSTGEKKGYKLLWYILLWHILLGPPHISETPYYWDPLEFGINLVGPPPTNMSYTKFILYPPLIRGVTVICLTVTCATVICTPFFSPLETNEKRRKWLIPRRFHNAHARPALKNDQISTKIESKTW
jgi:hypothetical protein